MKNTISSNKNGNQLNTISIWFRLPLCLFTPKRYLSRPALIRQFLLNSVITVLVILVLLYRGEDILFFKKFKDIVLDQVMYWHSDFEPITKEGLKMQHMAVIEIDNLAYRQWGSPVIMPRDKLRYLIEQVEQGGANVIAIDLDLTWLSDGCFHEPNQTPVCSPSNLNTDIALGLYLQKLNEEFYDDRKYDTPIILLGRTYRKPLDEYGRIKTAAFLEKPYSFLEGYLKEEHNVFWTARFFEADADRVLRRWQLAALVCEDNHLTVVPSMPLLAAIAQLHSCQDSSRKAAYMIRDFKQRLNQWAQTLPCDPSQGTTIPQLCQKVACPDLTITVPNKVGVCDEVHTIDLASGSDTERIIYRFAPVDNHTINQHSLIDRYTALEVLDQGISVEQQIVFIGATHEDNQDHHVIPIRQQEVASIYIVANAVDTLLRFGQFQTQSFIYKIVIAMGLVIILTLIFTYYQFIIALILSNILVGIVLFIGNEAALHHGIGLEIVLMLLTIQLVQIIWWLLRIVGRKLLFC